MRQVRAEETRNALLLAAARMFDREGYDRTTLAAISDLAAVSKGALSFHFSSKAELADAVQYLSCERARAELGALDDPTVPAIEALAAVVRAAAHGLATDPLARAGLRLVRERGTSPTSALDCRQAWRTALERVVLRAYEERSLRPGVNPTTVVDLALALVLHQEAVLPDRDRDSWLTDVWNLVLPALTHPTAPTRTTPALTTGGEPSGR
ncbi:TetR family transcriptional regulator [Streptomyces sp. NPDC051315]|uniref:TetR family transcriptional regulator n=1 Tax=Streptomyces sp. NPDC051315 TaxID=3365650 RepID=UPI0037B1F3F6